MAADRVIYLDSHSTTPVDPRVVEAMLPYFMAKFGNPGSITHSYGHEAAEAVEHARAVIAGALNADPREIVFTSGATESNNLAIKGAAEALAPERRRFVTSAIEHRAVLDPMRKLKKRGFEVHLFPVDGLGHTDIGAIDQALGEPTGFVSFMHANNEIGVINDVAAIGALCRERDVLFHVDAAQTVGKLPIDVQAMNIHLMSMSAHKFYGPKGVGAVYVRRKNPRVRLEAMIDGGGHERGLRSGTLNVAGIVGMAKALEIASAEMAAESARIGALRDRLRKKLFAGLDQIEVNGDEALRLPQNLNVAFHYVDSAALINAVPDIAVSTGSACSSADPEPSHVLLAIGKSEEHARSSIRFGLTRWTTEEEIDYAAGKIVAAVRGLRKQSGLYSF